MQRPPQSIEIGGTKYKVHASAPEEELTRLAALVDARLRELSPRGKMVTPQTFLLVALSFAHDAEVERATKRRVEAETRDILRRVLARIDLALEDEDDDGVDGDDADERGVDATDGEPLPEPTS